MKTKKQVVKFGMKVFCLGILVSSNTYAGGKAVAPAESVVAPIALTSPLPFYVGIGILWTGVREECVCGDDIIDSTYGGIIRAGWEYNQYIGIEARGIYSPIEDDFSKTQHYGIYLKPMYHVGDSVNIYALAGYGRTEIKGNTPTRSFASNGFSYGAGLEYDFGVDTSEGSYARGFDGQGNQEKSWGMWIDYQNLLLDKGPRDVNTNIVSVGLTYDF